MAQAKIPRPLKAETQSSEQKSTSNGKDGNVTKKKKKVRDDGLWSPFWFRQSWWFVDQWWMYDPRTTRLWIDEVKKTDGRDLWDIISYLRISDSQLYGMLMERSAVNDPSPCRVVQKNIRRVIYENYPKAFAKCCACNPNLAAGHMDSATHHWVESGPPPCSASHHLTSDLCLKSMIPLTERLRLLVDELGIFGFGNYNRFLLVDAGAFNGQSPRGLGLHWCINNCFRPDAWDHMQRIKSRDREGLKALWVKTMV
eukprot:gnl/MRDRNA2_/MRDRNA2_128103_c0_seq1.p1 gnl/MRDRNA2_/MRDRNA2_128103_c0~~gnl/MRDRNA2_/MRDRNA2_128103_c0_seq1.p1  ORF type:complete len:255 (-),score=23.83 gnl/MRDRNA2_/MRDRNA2_128103_c0_seq1:60-824(-)